MIDQLDAAIEYVRDGNVKNHKMAIIILSALNEQKRRLLQEPIKTVGEFSREHTKDGLIERELRELKDGEYVSFPCTRESVETLRVQLSRVARRLGIKYKSQFELNRISVRRAS